MTDDRREQLAEALIANGIWWAGDAPGIADALLPVVNRMIRQAQAEALESAADRSGDHGRHQAAEAFDHRPVAGSMAGVDCRCGWHGRGADHPAHVDAEHRAALAATRADEAARWTAKIEALITNLLTAGDRIIVPVLRALLDGDR